MDLYDHYTSEQISSMRETIKAAGLDSEVCPYNTPRLFLETHSNAVFVLNGKAAWAEFAQCGETSVSLGDLFPK